MYRASILDKVKMRRRLRGKFFFQPQKGKTPTKGAKQILMENTATVSFYRNMALGAGLFHCLLLIAIYADSITPLTIVSAFYYLTVLWLWFGKTVFTGNVRCVMKTVLPNLHKTIVSQKRMCKGCHGK